MPMLGHPGRGETVALPGRVSAYLTRPAEPGPNGPPWPGMVLIHELFGLDDNARALADRLADLGYVVVVPDLFPGGRARCLVRTFRASLAGTGPVFEDIEAARSYAAALADCTGRMGIIGFCMGGGFAMVAARSGFEACLPFYGALPVSPAPRLAGCEARIEPSFGMADRLIPRGSAYQVARTDAALTAAGIEHAIRTYPGAGHSFMSEPSVQAPANAVEAWFRRVLGVGPDPEAAELAWAHIEAFLADRLVG